jgi:hypothetical protein
VSEHFVVPSIGSRDVARAERPNIWRFEHFLQLLNFVNNAFNVHAPQSSKKNRGWVKPKGHWCLVRDVVPINQPGRQLTTVAPAWGAIRDWGLIVD